MDARARAKRYEKLDFLGEGQFATVYKARDKNTNQIVAIKKIKLGHRSEAKDGCCLSGILHQAACFPVKHLGSRLFRSTLGEEFSKRNRVPIPESSRWASCHRAMIHLVCSGLMCFEGINRTALREIKLLQELSHPNIIGLLDAFGHKSNISLVFDFMETDLEVIIKDTSIVLTQSHIKAYMLMTLQGLEYLHQHWILHRDLKPNNLLLDENGVLKLADFGLAKSFGSPNRVYTHQVVTRWYRAPELLFGARMYGVGVDMWAVGCILAELLLRVPFLPGDSDLDQLTRIFETLGTPTEEQWPGMTSLPDYVTFKSFPGMPLQHIFSAAGDDLLDLLQGLFTFNPCARVTATQALKQKYFSNRPGPTPGSQLPRPNCPAEALKEQQNALLNLKRKRTEGIDQASRLQ
ncbi:cyclin-dependent kinase 7 isoform X2 [Apteryx rowi]|uniref:cyclin-dependent kinase 7 isoform X2 n=1 Tax=Apteryx rowi TaxID=308060 RepID=UPI000E1D6F3B|nr:cyclin-dependent kinase 7 isoform X2 [Apteryx rowi]